MSCVISLLTLGLMITLVIGDNCPYKECYCIDQEIFCNDRQLKKIPQIHVTNRPITSILAFDGNEITTIPAGSLPANLSDISLGLNPIETIDDAAFDESIYTLQKIFFSGAQFTQIPEAVFHLKALSSLTIDQTNILDWNEDGMQRLGSTMETLSLTTVGLTSWPIWMKSMTNLTELTVTGNTISVIPDDALDLVANTLTELDLSNNSLTTLPKSLAKIKMLTQLKLVQNRINDITWLPQLSPLYTLSLNNNKITDAQTLSNVLKPHAGSLTTFDIQDNSLTSIPVLSFMTKVTYLDFTSNHISDSNTGSVPSNLIGLVFDNNFLPSIPGVMSNLKFIYMLNLNSNNIRIIKGTEFPPKIVNIDLGSNLISELSLSSLPHSSTVSILSLNNNPITTISPDAFDNIPSLTELDLRDTKLTRLPIAISSLTFLERIDVSDNANLVCTCQEQSLQSRIQAIESFYVLGNCGETSVHFFFTNLSPQCPDIL